MPAARSPHSWSSPCCCSSPPRRCSPALFWLLRQVLTGWPVLPPWPERAAVVPWGAGTVLLVIVTWVVVNIARVRRPISRSGRMSVSGRAEKPPEALVLPAPKPDSRRPRPEYAPGPAPALHRADGPGLADQRHPGSSSSRRAPSHVGRSWPGPRPDGRQARAEREGRGRGVPGGHADRDGGQRPRADGLEAEPAPPRKDAPGGGQPRPDRAGVPLGRRAGPGRRGADLPGRDPGLAPSSGSRNECDRPQKLGPPDPEGVTELFAGTPVPTSGRSPVAAANPGDLLTAAARIGAPLRAPPADFSGKAGPPLWPDIRSHGELCRSS